MAYVCVYIYICMCIYMYMKNVEMELPTVVELSDQDPLSCGTAERVLRQYALIAGGFLETLF